MKWRARIRSRERRYVGTSGPPQSRWADDYSRQAIHPHVLYMSYVQLIMAVKFTYMHNGGPKTLDEKT